jgi:hypothetical protein
VRSCAAVLVVGGDGVQTKPIYQYLKRIKSL